MEDRVVIEVHPRYLVPDTNTFIDHLESIIRIVECGMYEVCVTTTGIFLLKVQFFSQRK